MEESGTLWHRAGTVPQIPTVQQWRASSLVQRAWTAWWIAGRHVGTELQGGKANGSAEESSGMRIGRIRCHGILGSL